jgi:hypothetical protein
MRAIPCSLRSDRTVPGLPTYRTRMSAWGFQDVEGILCPRASSTWILSTEFSRRLRHRTMMMLLSQRVIAALTSSKNANPISTRLRLLLHAVRPATPGRQSRWSCPAMRPLDTATLTALLPSSQLRINSSQTKSLTARLRTLSLLSSRHRSGEHDICRRASCRPRLAPLHVVKRLLWNVNKLNKLLGMPVMQNNTFKPVWHPVRPKQRQPLDHAPHPPALLQRGHRSQPHQRPYATLSVPPLLCTSGRFRRPPPEQGAILRPPQHPLGTRRQLSAGRG